MATNTTKTTPSWLITLVAIGSVLAVASAFILFIFPTKADVSKVEYQQEKCEIKLTAKIESNTSRIISVKEQFSTFSKSLEELRKEQEILNSNLVKLLIRFRIQPSRQDVSTEGQE